MSLFVFFTETFQSITSNRATNVCNIFKITMKKIITFHLFF